MRGGSAVAEISTGPRNRNANGFSQPAGEEQQHRELGDVEGEQPCGALGLEPLRQAEAQAQRDIEPRRERDHREAGPDRQREVEPVMDHQHRGRLPDDREPAQPHQRVEPHVARLRQVRDVGGVVEHRRDLSAAGRCSQCCEPTRALASQPQADRRGLRGPRAASHLPGHARPRRRSHARHRRRPPGQASTRASPRSTAFRLRSRPARCTGAARRQRRRQDHHDRHDHGSGHADLRHASRCSASTCRAAPPRAASDEFRKPLCRTCRCG